MWNNEEMALEGRTDGKATTERFFPTREKGFNECGGNWRKGDFEIGKQTNGYHFCESQHSYSKYILINSYK